MPPDVRHLLLGEHRIHRQVLQAPPGQLCERQLQRVTSWACAACPHLLRASLAAHGNAQLSQIEVELAKLQQELGAKKSFVAACGALAAKCDGCVLRAEQRQHGHCVHDRLLQDLRAISGCSIAFKFSPETGPN